MIDYLTQQLEPMSELEGSSVDVPSNDFVCAALGGKLDVVRTALDAGQSIEATDVVR